jgi:farnesyl diphosphate synthase
MITTLTLDTLHPLCGARLTQMFSSYLNEIPSLELKQSMQYTLLNRGKYIRPLLIYATGQIFDASLDNLDLPASAVELIHTYSLIHDDLPCMDNADLRRGRAACHCVYGEAIAILTGDALHTLAIQILASHRAPLPTDRRLQMIAALSKACGPFGMAAGQALDLTTMGEETVSPDLLDTVYRLKTGALISACVELGRLSSKDNDSLNQTALKTFGDCIGFAFQIQDDILDKEATTASLGKNQGLDLKNNKITYPVLFGMQNAKDKVQSLYEEALDSINYLGNKAGLLRALAKEMFARKK